MDWTFCLALAALALALAALGWGAWTWWQVRTLGMGLGGASGALPERLGEVGRRLAALESAQGALEKELGRLGLRPAVVHYAPLGLGGARNCFVLALLNREGDGIVLNYLSGTAVRAEVKEVRAWQSRGTAFTPEEEQAVAAARG